MITHVIFTKRAFNAIITETIDKNPVETGGIFIGYLLDNGVCIVVETIPPGIKTVNQRAYFEYDADFINYLSNVIAKQYVGNLHVLGLWHRHPGSMDSFSTTDDGTNILFARNNGKYGAISALVNCDPKLRLTMYHVDSNCRYTPNDLCSEWSIPKQTINTAVAALQKKGVAFLSPIPGTRNKKNIAFTEFGRDFAEKTVGILRMAELDALAELSPEERELYIRLNEKYNCRLIEKLYRIMDEVNQDRKDCD